MKNKRERHPPVASSPRRQVPLPKSDWDAGIAALRHIVRIVAPLRGKRRREALAAIRALAYRAAGEAEIEAFIRLMEGSQP